ncbi:MAG TPA: hypothetical protein VN688_12995 [Gemmataceae bacterium]|nr:hypothetical protein [Gemmataceae bacterium]
MDSIELGVLEACHEVVLRQRELLPYLAETLKVAEDRVFYTWAFRQCKQHGDLAGTDWVYFFHGLECDLKNVTDGRFLRIDFGPHGRVDTFSAWGVLQFVMTSIPPWPEFPQLKACFAKGAPPFDQYSGALDKMVPIWDRLEAKGAFEEADPSLVELEAQHTSRGPDGLRYVRLPPELPEETQVDCSVAGRRQLSRYGLQLLEMHLTNRCPITRGATSTV